MKKKTRKKKKSSLVLPLTTPNPSLPNDLLIVLPDSLSLVSKSFGSLLASPELYKTRSSLGNTESCLYVCSQFPHDPNPRLFTLCRKPNKTITNDTGKKSSGYVLATVSIPHPPPAHWFGVVSIGSDIYNIGGCSDKAPSSSVSILDCRSHTWREGPSMQVERNYAAANVVDGKIYVTGGCEGCSSSNWMEVFDPRTRTWELVSSPGLKTCGCDIHKSAGIDGKLYTFGKLFTLRRRNGLEYEPKEGTWKMVGWEMGLDWPWFCYSVIENVLYYYSEGKFKWYDNRDEFFGNLIWVGEELPKFASYACVKLAEYGGKMVVLWDEFVPSSGYKKMMIWCAVIALERVNEDEMLGKVEWFDAVLTVPKSYEFGYALSATV